MNFNLIKIMALMEVRLRTRRLGTVIALLAVIALTWILIVDPKNGMSMLVVKSARPLYNSAALALGSATISSMLLGLIGFYLVRGRMVEDLRSGIGGVIASTQVGTVSFLIGRWLGGAAYLALISITVMSTMLVRHALTGDGPIQILVYLQTYALFQLPLIFFCTSIALLFDSFPPLMGKVGDVLYFILWAAVFVTLGEAGRAMKESGSSILAFDFWGMGTLMLVMLHHFGTTLITVGAGPFDPTLPMRILPADLWWGTPVMYRGICAVVALVPLLPALALFHRYSPDRIKPSASRQRRSPLALLNNVLRPLSAVARPLFAFASRLPGFSGQVVAELALSLVASPIAILALIALPIASLVMPLTNLGLLLTIAVTIWMILIADLSTRDYQADTEALTGGMKNGIEGRYVRQFVATALLGYLFMAVIAIRWSFAQPILAIALLTGVFCLSALAAMLGRSTRTSRSFIMLSLFWVFVAVQTRELTWVDLVGFNGAANWSSIAMQTAIGVSALVFGYGYNRWQAR
jgi:hypothetical protein